jgi:DNA-binding XRE family transcriptional regulator
VLIKMPATRPIDQLRREAAALIVAQIKKTTVAKAASKLRVSRQALYDIMDGKYCPSMALIQRACQAWKLEFKFRGLNVGEVTLHRKRSQSNLPVQTNLVFEALELLEKQPLAVVKAQRVGKAVELVFRFTLTA